MFWNVANDVAMFCGWTVIVCALLGAAAVSISEADRALTRWTADRRMARMLADHNDRCDRMAFGSWDADRDLAELSRERRAA